MYVHMHIYIILFSRPLVYVFIIGQQLASMDQYMVDQEEEVLSKAAKLEAVGYKTYLKESSSSGP